VLSYGTYNLNKTCQFSVGYHSVLCAEILMKFGM